MIKKIRHQILTNLKLISSLNYKPNNTKYIHKNVTYYSQWESKELVGDILSRKLTSYDDPKWKLSGAKDIEEYALWSFNSCGMACFKMVLEYFTGKKIPIIVLGNICKKYGGYKENIKAIKNKDYINALPGLYYKPFVEFVQKEYALKANIISPMIIADILNALENKNLVMASVGATIRDPKIIDTYKGGHLVLIVGYDWKKKTFYLHNPSGIYQKSQMYAEISFDDFNKFFDNKGIVIYE